MRTSWRIMANLFKWTWRLINFIREFILNIFMVLLILVGVGVWAHIKNVNQPIDVQQGALNIDLAGVVVDKPSVTNALSKMSRQLLGINSNRLNEDSLFDIVAAIRQAKTDKRINGIVLNLRNFAGGDQPSLQYIGKALHEFRDSGKPIYAYGNNFTQAQYYLASFANKIYLSPYGSIDLHGFATNSLYYKSLLDRLKVSSHIFRVGTYKSAVEPFLRDDMSQAARDADTRWIGQLWNNFVAQIAANRQLSPDEVFPGAKQYIATLQKKYGDMAKYALDARLVDELATPTQVDQHLIKVFGWNKQTKDYRGTSIYDYSLRKQPVKGNIAVIFANGAIVDGEQTPGTVGSDTAAAEIRSARLDSAIKAIILRVNSPGGSVAASETIREELAATRAAGKPIVVSMGGMAASGGYWISTPANYIIASPGTLTGSIGIFGIINTLEKSLDAIGVHADGITTSPLADVSVTKTLPPEVQQIMQISIESGYKNFLNLVAKSRNMTPDQVDKIAQGRVWTGSDAKAKGLVDALGDFDNAVKKAAELAKINHPELHWYQEQPSFTDMLFGQVNAQLHAALPGTLRSLLPTPIYDVMSMMKKQPGLFDKMNDPQNRYAMCLNCSEVR